MMISYQLLMTFFMPMRSKHCITDGTSVWTARRTILKNKPHLVTFHESMLVSIYIYIYIYIN